MRVIKKYKLNPFIMPPSIDLWANIKPQCSSPGALEFNLQSYGTSALVGQFESVRDKVSRKRLLPLVIFKKVRIITIFNLKKL